MAQIERLMAEAEVPTLAIANSSGVVTAERPVTIPEQPQRPPSYFEQIQNQIKELEQQQPSPDRDLALQRAREAKDTLRQEANELRLPNGEIGIFNQPKAELSAIYYGSRVGVTREEKEGRGDFAGRSKLQFLEERRRDAYDPRFSLEVDRIDPRTGETRFGYWSDPQHPERRGLEQRYGGMIDDLNQGGMDLILTVVSDRKIYTQEHDRYTSYPPNRSGIASIWNGVIRDVAGHTIKDEEGNDKIAVNFDDVREAIEEVRRQLPWVPNRMDYETYIRFVADDLGELREMMPYIIARVVRRLGTGQPDKLSTRGEQDKERLDGAMANFPMESEGDFRRVKSELNVNLNSTLAYLFSDQVRNDWGPYLSYLNLLAEGAQNTEQQDHLADAYILDPEGLTMLAAQQYLVEDGIFWRYGQKSANLDKEARDMNKLYRWQARRKRGISHFLMSGRLRRMDDLLNLTLDEAGNITAYGVPKHSAFQRLKTLFDEMDAADIRKTGHILDVDEEPTNETRWQEYCRKALDWQKRGKSGDPGETPRVLFQHPLARSFKRPVKTATGQVYYEFLDMFEKDPDVSEEFLASIKRGSKAQNATWYERTKSRKVKSNMQKAEQLCRNLMLDSAAVLAWHVFKTPEEVAEVNKYLVAAGMEPITINEAVQHKTLYRAIMQACIREDRTKLPKDRTFKMYDVLTELLGIDIDVPTFGAWYIGAHDTTRPTLLLAAIERDTRRGSLKEAIPAPGMDEKNSGAAWSEKERRMGLLAEMVMFAKFGRTPRGSRYFNFPGHDTKGAERKGAGVKDIRNYLNLLYGTSTNTVWLNDLLGVALPLEPELPKNYGATEDVITELVGLMKGGNEAIFAQTGYEGILENPRDWTSAVKRTATNVEHSKALTTGNKEGFALMKDGPIAGGYLWRDYDLANLKDKYENEHLDPFFAINNPVEAIKDMKEATYRVGIDLAKQVFAPTIKLMKDVVDSTFGPNPGTARAARTLIWYGISKWMDTSWEFRQKPGYAVDANLHLARYFMHTLLLEWGDNGLIYNDREWDQIMLGYIRRPDGSAGSVRYEIKIEGDRQMVKDENGNWIVEKIKDPSGTWVVQQFRDQTGELIDLVEDGLIDGFPKELRDEIIEGRDLEVKDSAGRVVKVIPKGDYMLPFGLDSQYPETFANYYRDSEAVKRDYANALKVQVKRRKTVARP